MAEVKWIKITTTMFEDEKIDFIESLPEADAILVVWVKLLTMAGRNNSNGFIFLTEQIPYTPEMLAHRFRRPLNTIKLALETLKSLGMIGYTDDGFLNITNWEKHQNIEGLDKIREQTRLRVARHRENKKLLENSNVICNVTVTEGNATEQEQEEEREEELDIDKEQQQEEEGSGSSYPQKPVDKSKDKKLSKIATAFEQNGFGTISGIVKDELVGLLDEFSPEWIIEAFKIAVKANKRTLNYVEGILNNWRAQGGMKTESDKPTQTFHKPVKKTGFHNFKSRTEEYTADELNRKVEEKAERKKREYLERIRKQKEDGD